MDDITDLYRMVAFANLYTFVKEYLLKHSESTVELLEELFKAQLSDMIICLLVLLPGSYKRNRNVNA